jgi:hypothetical protein
VLPRAPEFQLESDGKPVHLTRRPVIYRVVEAKGSSFSAAQAEAGDFDAAVKSQSKAISLLTDPAKKQDYRSRLMLYEQHKPYRTPLP